MFELIKSLIIINFVDPKYDAHAVITRIVRNMISGIVRTEHFVRLLLYNVFIVNKAVTIGAVALYLLVVLFSI